MKKNLLFVGGQDIHLLADIYVIKDNIIHN